MDPFIRQPTGSPSPCSAQTDTHARLPIYGPTLNYPKAIDQASIKLRPACLRPTTCATPHACCPSSVRSSTHEIARH